jgi:hypothetical protein
MLLMIACANVNLLLARNTERARVRIAGSAGGVAPGDRAANLDREPRIRARPQGSVAGTGCVNTILPLATESIPAFLRQASTGGCWRFDCHGGADKRTV